MSDPLPRPPRPSGDLRSRPEDPPPPRRAGANLLLWLLLLVVVIAIAWYFLGRHDDRALPPDVVPIEETVPQPSQSPVSTPPESRETSARERTAPVPAPPDRAARPLTRSAPVYPAAAQRTGEQGRLQPQLPRRPSRA